MRIILLGMICLLLLTATNGFASLDQFAGYWTNVDPNTRGIVALNIAVEGSSANVQAWGSCHPTPCDWGTVAANAFATDVSSDISNAAAMTAVFDSGFSETTLVMSPSGGQLKVESYDHFKDNSGRSNYAATYTFEKSQAPGQTIPGGSPAVLDLTGVWNCDDGGKYYIRQLGNDIWWYGEKDPNTPDWSNVMHGTLSGNTITADWADVPKGNVMQSGALTLNVVSSNEIAAIQKTGGFAGSSWTRAI